MKTDAPHESKPSEIMVWDVHVLGFLLTLAYLATFFVTAFLVEGQLAIANALAETGEMSPKRFYLFLPAIVGFLVTPLLWTLVKIKYRRKCPTCGSSCRFQSELEGARSFY